MSEKIYWIRESGHVTDGKPFKGKPVACVVSCLTPGGKDPYGWSVHYSVATQNPEDNLDKRLGVNIALGRLSRRDKDKLNQPEVFQISLNSEEKSYPKILQLILKDIVARKMTFPSRVVRNAQRTLRDFDNKVKQVENVDSK